MRRSQRQSGGDSSSNIQAGHDVVVHQGITAEEARHIALDVFHANFLKLRDVAEEVAIARAEKITKAFLEELSRRQPNGLGRIQDPDMLQAVFNAQKGYACSGEEDLEQVLIDLLVDRAGQEVRDIKALVLNEAITTVPKLTHEQRDAITAFFLVNHAPYHGPLHLPTFYSYIEKNLAPLADKIPTKWAEYLHVQYAGAGVVSKFKTLIEMAMRHNLPTLFTIGFKPDAVRGQLHRYLDDPAVFIRCLRDQKNLQVNVLSPDRDIPNLKVDEDSAKELRQLAFAFIMADGAIKKDLVEHVPGMSRLFDVWNESGISSMELTTVGLAIGHAHWRRITGGTSDLDAWL